MQISSVIVDKQEIIATIEDLVNTEFHFTKNIINEQLKPYLDHLRDDIDAFIDYPYVERIYRDCYYHYFSTKHYNHPRNCIRIGFFEKGLTHDHFLEKEKFPETQSKFLGYCTIRPIKIRILGQSIISPKLLKINNFVCCLVKKVISFSGLRLTIDAFPHYCQDDEMLKCAETSLLILIDYFSSKYPDYKTLLPSEIISVLAKKANERQVPSNGLTTDYISYVLKEIGFGTKIYSQKIPSFKDNDEFKKLLFSYIESGIPIIAAIEDEKQNIGHAMVVIGRENVNETTKIKPQYFKKDFIDFADQINNLVVMDDNRSPYQLVPFNKPTQGYDPYYKDCVISSFVVPLYPKIHVGADQAKALFNSIIHEHGLLSKRRDKILRYFLTTSNAYKQYIVSNASINNDIKAFIIDIAMPKFIWVAELIPGKFETNQKTMGIIVVDATGSKLNDNLLFVAFPRKVIFKDLKQNEYFILDIDFENFSIFATNLKGAHTLWQS